MIENQVKETPRLALIVAVNKLGYIGKDNDLPWSRREFDLQWFKTQTRSHSVLMGRHTFESLKRKPLSERHNIVVTSKMDLDYLNEIEEDLNITHSFLEAVKVFQYENRVVTDGTGSLFVIGGQSVYDFFLPLATEIYLTIIDDETVGDVQMPILLSLPDHPEYEILGKFTHEGEKFYHFGRKADVHPLAKPLTMEQIEVFEILNQ